MEKRTAEIIMICKGRHNYGKNLNYKETIAKYISDVCGLPIEYCTESEINSIIYDAVLDYIDGLNRPSTFIKDVVAAYDLYKHNNKNTTEFDMWSAVCVAFRHQQVQKNNEYINGFTVENTQFVHKSKQEV